MKTITCIIIILSSITFTNGQLIFEKQTPKTKFDIRFPPPDSVKPIIKVQLPKKKEGFPVYSRDSIFTVSGHAEDNSGKVTIYIQDIKQIIPNGLFKIDVKMHPGLNIVNLKAVDRRDNLFKDSIKVVYDPNADVIPPTLKITEPMLSEQRGIKIVPKYAGIDSMILVKGKVLDEGSILGVWVNGDPISVNENSEFSFSIHNLFDSVVVEASDMYGNLTTEKFLITSFKMENIPDSIKYHAFIIAVEEYYDVRISELDYPIKDAEALIDVLTTQYTFDTKNILFLKNPDRKLILEEFQNFRNKLGDSDNLLIFYAGHGNYDSLNQQGYWVPSDGASDISTNWISNEDVRDYIRGIKTRHTLVIADACFAGSLSRDLGLAGASLLEFEETYKYPSRKILSGGIELGKVPDKSVFFEFLLKKLKENQKQILPGRELAYLIKEPVMNNSSNQIPAYNVIKNTGDDGPGDFIFIKKVRE